GLVKTVPDGLDPGSDVANMSLLGFDPAKYYTGRAPIEAASLGVALAPDETAFRCNFVHLADGRMADYASGHIETDVASRILRELAGGLDSDRVKFHPGTSYRHLLVIKNMPEGELVCTPPHDISDETYAPHLPKGAGREILAELSEKAREILRNSPVNQELAAAGKTTVTDIWPWGQGGAATFPSLMDRYGLRGSVISAVDLVKGLGVLSGMTVREVEGATGYLGTNYAGKVEAAVEAMKSEDFVYLHIEAPDETSHEGSLGKKLQAIEEFDENVVGEILKLRHEYDDLRIMVLPDHPTLLSTKTHDSSPVPFAVRGSAIPRDDATTYSEKSARGSARNHFNGVSLFDAFIKGGF
ncbi:MAG: cofactor-independent phosphoglycerate mutase, partial [Desulfobacterales bacterium]|nr:cofactor-independent phosphoglycerate mutase [Desulfobacterales bacterium]